MWLRIKQLTNTHIHNDTTYTTQCHFSVPVLFRMHHMIKYASTLLAFDIHIGSNSSVAWDQLIQPSEAQKHRAAVTIRWRQTDFSFAELSFECKRTKMILTFRLLMNRWEPWPASSRQVVCSPRFWRKRTPVAVEETSLNLAQMFTLTSVNGFYFGPKVKVTILLRLAHVVKVRSEEHFCGSPPSSPPLYR